MYKLKRISNKKDWETFTEIVETTYSQMVIEIQEIQLNVSARIRVILYDNLKSKADVKNLILSLAING